MLETGDSESESLGFTHGHQDLSPCQYLLPSLICRCPAPFARIQHAGNNTRSPIFAYAAELELICFLDVSSGLTTRCLIRLGLLFFSYRVAAFAPGIDVACESPCPLYALLFLIPINASYSEIDLPISRNRDLIFVTPYLLLKTTASAIKANQAK